MKKDNFWIRYRERGLICRKQVNGYIYQLDEIEIGIRRVTSHIWQATELSTGLLVCSGETRELCLQYASTEEEKARIRKCLTQQQEHMRRGRTQALMDLRTLDEIQRIVSILLEGSESSEE